MVKKLGIGGSKKAKNIAKKATTVRISGASINTIEKQSSKKPRNTSTVPKAPKDGARRDLQRKHNATFGAALAALFGKLAFWRSFREYGAKGSGALKSDNTNKNRKRNRYITLYAAAGLIVAAVLLIVLVPGGEAASTQVATMDDSSAAAVSQEADPTETSDERRYTSVGDAPIETGQTPIETKDSNPTAVPTTESPMVMAATPIETTPPDVTTTPIDIDELVDYFRVDADLYYNQVGYSTNYYNYTDNEIYMLAQVIHSEARGESYTGKIAVGNVVMNRVLLRGYFGSSITSVVTAPSQFAYNPNTTPSWESKSAAKAVLDYQKWVIPQYVYYFHSTRPAGVDWSSHKFFSEIGNHCFYTHNYYGRSRINKVPPALFDRTYQWPQLGCKPEDRAYRVQYILNALGYDVYADKFFGQDTKDAIKSFQEKKGLDADGVAGPSTIEALINAFGLAEYYQKFYM